VQQQVPECIIVIQAPVVINPRPPTKEITGEVGGQFLVNTEVDPGSEVQPHPPVTRLVETQKEAMRSLARRWNAAKPKFLQLLGEPVQRAGFDEDIDITATFDRLLPAT
jgi:hypothetical protein